MQFIQTMNGGIHQNFKGHLEMPFPFKSRPQLPDNKQLALVRLKHLKRKFEKNPKFKEDNIKFMDGVFQVGDAESSTQRRKCVVHSTQRDISPKEAREN